MVFEHFAVNVADVAKVVQWYTTHLGLEVASQQASSPFMTFLKDSSGRVVFEFYQRTDAPVTSFSEVHPGTFHVAFISENAKKDSMRLEKEGAVFVEEVLKEDGSHLIMLRDPFHMPLQLCQRAINF